METEKAIWIRIGCAIVFCVLSFIIGNRFVNLGIINSEIPNSLVRYDLVSLKNALISYQRVSEALPTNEEGLDIIFVRPEEGVVAQKWPRKGFFRPNSSQYQASSNSIPLDPWGHDFVYQKNSDGTFLLFSHGKSKDTSIDDIVLSDIKDDEGFYRLRIQFLNLRKGNITLQVFLLCLVLLVTAVIFGVVREPKKLNLMMNLVDIMNIIKGDDPSDVLYRVSLRVSGFFDTIRCAFVVVKKGHNEAYVLASQDNPEKKVFKLDLNKYPEIQEVLKTDKQLIIDNLDDNNILSGVVEKLLEKNIKMIIALPIRNEKNEICALFFLRTGKHRIFTPDEVYLSQTISRSVLPFIQKHSIYEQFFLADTIATSMKYA